MIEAIIFDCDGVLVDSEVLAIRGERTALGALGLHYDPQTYVDRFVGMHDRLFFDTLRQDYRTIHGGEAPPDFEEKVLDGRRKHKDGLEAISGAAAAIAAAREAVGNVAVASSSRAHFLTSKLERTGLHALLAPHIYSADLVEHGKPAPDIFHHAARQLGVPAERCLVLEDSKNGVAAGVAAGMTVWGFTGGGHCFAGYSKKLIAAGAHAVKEDFASFIAALETLNS